MQGEIIDLNSQVLAKPSSRPFPMLQSDYISDLCQTQDIPAIINGAPLGPYTRHVPSFAHLYRGGDVTEDVAPIARAPIVQGRPAVPLKTTTSATQLTPTSSSPAFQSTLPKPAVSVAALTSTLVVPAAKSQPSAPNLLSIFAQKPLTAPAVSSAPVGPSNTRPSIFGSIAAAAEPVKVAATSVASSSAAQALPKPEEVKSVFATTKFAAPVSITQNEVPILPAKSPTPAPATEVDRDEEERQRVAKEQEIAKQKVIREQEAERARRQAVEAEQQRQAAAERDAAMRVLGEYLASDMIDTAVTDELEASTRYWVLDCVAERFVNHPVHSHFTTINTDIARQCCFIGSAIATGAPCART